MAEFSEEESRTGVGNDGFKTIQLARARVRSRLLGLRGSPAEVSQSDWHSLHCRYHEVRKQPEPRQTYCVML